MGNRGGVRRTRASAPGQVLPQLPSGPSPDIAHEPGPTSHRNLAGRYARQYSLAGLCGAVGYAITLPLDVQAAGFRAASEMSGRNAVRRPRSHDCYAERSMVVVAV